MKWFYNLKISVKLIISFLIVALIAGVVGYTGISNIKKIETNDKKTYENTTIPLTEIGQISTLFQRVRIESLYIITYNDNNKIEEQVKKIADYRNQINKLSDEFKTRLIKGDETKLYEEYKTARENYVKYLDQLIDLASTSNNQDTLAFATSLEYQESVNAYMNIIDKLVQNQIDEAKQFSDNNIETSNKATNLMIILVVLGVLLSIGLGVFISRIISRPINKLMDAAKRISEGNLDVDLKIDTTDEVGILGKAFEKIVLSLQTLIGDTEMLVEAAIQEKFDIRADVAKHNGDYKKIIEGVNNTLDKVADKNNWYEAIIDAVPFPIHVTDDNMNWTFLNNAFEKLMIDAGRVKDRRQAVGMACSNASANICNTELCGIKQLQKGNPESFFDWCGMSCKQNTSHLVNRKGQKIGYVEVVTDLTSILRVNEYTKEEVNRMAANLDMLANGDLKLNLKIKEADQYTKETKESFEKINNNLIEVKNTVGTLIEEAGMLTNASIEGKLDIRGDLGKFKGAYKEVIGGMNKTLDAIIAPIKESAIALEEIAKGNLNVSVNGDYKGDYVKIKDAVNLTVKSMLGYIGETSNILEEISKGNLDVEITSDFKGDFIKMKNSINSIIKSFNDVLGEFDSAADQVAAGARHVSNSSQALSQASAEQASSVEEITASITQIASQTKQNASNANQANELAITTKENAIEGNEKMKEMLKAMAGINDSSSNISKIIKVIDEIAFQTNILALNAAVEAARAGQHGKGFAVVAEEVRNLAARSANAAKETTDMIEGSIKKVESGTEIANDTADALNKIVGDITKAANIVSEIAVASNEQATAIAQINQGIYQVSQITQTNTATSEESASASEELSSQSQLLKDMIKRFKLKDTNINSKTYKVTDKKPIESYQSQQYIRPTNYQKELSDHKVKISLDDNEFGKY